jgi:hypothetical protein
MPIQSVRIPFMVALLVLSACATRPPANEGAVAGVVTPSIPAETRGRFTLEADKLDTWNAVGQIVVNTPGVEYLGRSQMLDLYTVRYRGESFLILTKALLLADTLGRPTTQVTAATEQGGPIDSDASADLLALLQRELPAEIVRVRAKQAAEAKTKAKRKKGGKR